jgi:hypothetical protein
MIHGPAPNARSIAVMKLEGALTGKVLLELLTRRQ